MSEGGQSAGRGMPNRGLPNDQPLSEKQYLRSSAHLEARSPIGDAAAAPIGGTMPKLSAVVSDELAGALERRARAEDRSASAVVRRALAEHLDGGTPTTPVAAQPVDGQREPKEKR